MKHLKTIIGIVALCAVFSCTKSQNGECGHVSFEVRSNQTVEDVTRSNVSDYTALPSSNDFNIVIKDAENTQIWSGKCADWDPTTSLVEGDYSVEASYGFLEVEGFNKPYFVGSQTFTVVGNETVAVSVPVSLGNTIIRISCSDNFKNYYKDYSFRLSRDGSDVVTFSKDETRAAFIDGYKIKVEGTLTSETKTQTFSADYTNLSEATAYTLAFDVPSVGGSTITVSFNDTVNEVELGNIELND